MSDEPPRIKPRITRMTGIKHKLLKPPALTPEQRAEDDDLAQFCHAAAVRLFQRLDREEAAAGCAADYSSPARRRLSVRKKSVKSATSAVKKRFEP
jgi:hypothetical protein